MEIFALLTFIISILVFGFYSICDIVIRCKELKKKSMEDKKNK